MTSSEHGVYEEVELMAPIRVLMLVAAGTVDTGPVKGCLQLIKNINANNVEFVIVNFRVGRNDPQADIFKNEIESRGIKVDFLAQNGSNYWEMVNQFGEIIKRRKIDIIQSHGSKPAAICALSQLRQRIPWVCFSHGATNENMRVRVHNWIEDICRLVSDKPVYVAQSQTKRPLARINQKNITVIRNAVDIDAPTAFSSSGVSEIRARLGLTDCDRLVVVIARLSPEKGVDVLIDALAAESGAVGQCLHAAIVGDGPEKSNLERRVRRLKLEGRVHFVGYSRTPGDYLSAADVVVLPSRSEGIPNVALEAMALGKALVATKVGGVPEIVVDGETGILVPSEDVEALSSAISTIINDKSLATRFCDNAKKHAENNLSVNTRCQRVVNIYRELMDTSNVRERRGARRIWRSKKSSEMRGGE